MRRPRRVPEGPEPNRDGPGPLLPVTRSACEAIGVSEKAEREQAGSAPEQRSPSSPHSPPSPLSPASRSQEPPERPARGRKETGKEEKAESSREMCIPQRSEMARSGRETEAETRRRAPKRAAMEEERGICLMRGQKPPHGAFGTKACSEESGMPVRDARKRTLTATLTSESRLTQQSS